MAVRAEIIVITSDEGGGTCDCRRLSVCLYVCLLARLLKFCVSTDVGTWTNWLTFEPDPGHSPDAGTGFLYRISYTLRNFTALLVWRISRPIWRIINILAISVSICAKLARSIPMRDHNTATKLNFRQSLSKCRILSPKNS